ncbi:MAG TPA: alpha-amylase family glycosyl hydrolase [Anaerolineales bacterium]|nr:alpha-amylase family glycosyl hydrolase [Anaerolineales bacterium]
MTHERLHSLLSSLYGADYAAPTLGKLRRVLGKYEGRIRKPRAAGLSQRDAVLITYPDQIQEPGHAGLASLGGFAGKHLKGLVSGIHILPFYPWSSDDGFSVVDYEAVAPAYGQWEDVRRLGEHFRLMFDAVINHASAESQWFRRYARGDPAYRDFFLEVRGRPDLSRVVRPRALPLLTEYETSEGTRRLWTTFSADQVDLNYHNPDVLLRIIDVMLFYVSQGAEFIRLDAIAYLWKEVGTSCINLPQTHTVVQLMRAVLDEVSPSVMLITETNVPNRENLSYFGDGSNEAQLVYNFPLPPLVLHTLLSGDPGPLNNWAESLELPSRRTTFFNFLASHDGIGLNPVRGILPESGIDALAKRIETAGGFISKKTNPDGTQSAYELNANYFDALNAGNASAGQAEQVARFLAAHAILLAFQGVPALYFHSLFGSRGWPEGVRETGKHRSINRQKLGRDELERGLADPASRRAQIFSGLSHLLTVRAARPCFSPHASQRVLRGSSSVFTLLRENMESGQAALCVHNITPQPIQVSLDLSQTPLRRSAELRDIVGGRKITTDAHLPLTLQPFQFLWLVGEAGE